MLDAPVAMSVVLAPLSSEVRPYDNALLWAPMLPTASLATIGIAEAYIEQFANMPENWDGYGALSVNSETRRNALAAIRYLANFTPIETLSAEITPNPNGTLSFEWETQQGVAHLEIGQSLYSFYLRPTTGAPFFLDGNVAEIMPACRRIGNAVSQTLFPFTNPSKAFTDIILLTNVSPPYRYR